jgi:hypothetical protein
MSGSLTFSDHEVIRSASCPTLQKAFELPHVVTASLNAMGRLDELTPVSQYLV